MPHSDNTSLEIHRATEADYPELLTLWTTVFEQPASVFEPMYHSAGPDARFAFYLREGEKIVSSVQTFVMPVRDEQGNPVPVAGIANVSTLPVARRKGYSSHLLKATIAETEARGCGWSFLGTGIPHHYEKHGWRNVSNYVYSIPVAEGPELGPNVAVKPLGDLEEIRSLFERSFSKTPLTLVRHEGDWEIKIPSRVSQRKLALIPDRAYALFRVDGNKVNVDEWAALDDDKDLYGELLGAIRGYAIEKEAPELLVVAPLTPGATSACTQLAGARVVEEGRGMVRPISSEWSHERLEALFRLPNARFFGLDAF